MEQIPRNTTGYSTDEIKKVHEWGFFWAREDKARALQTAHEALEGGSSSIEGTVVTKNGKRIPFLTTANRVDFDGQTCILGMGIDISARKRAERALEEAARQWEHTFNSATDSIMLMDTEQRIIRCNSATEKLLNKKASEIVGCHCYELVHGAKGPIEGCPFIRMTKTHHRERMPLRLGDRWFEVTADAILNQTGQMTGSVHIVSDITERIRQEAALHQSEQRYRRLFEDSPVSLWEEDFSEVKKCIDILRSKGVSDFRAHFAEHPEDVSRCSRLVKILDINKVTLEMYEAENVSDLQAHLVEVIPKDSLDVFREQLIALAEGKGTFEGESVQTMAGETRNIRLMMNVVPGYKDTLEKVLVSIIDLTEQKRMEDELRKSTQFLGSIIENANVWMDVIDKEGNVLVWNKAAEAITGYSSEEVVGHRKIWEWLYPDPEYRKRIMDMEPDSRQENETRIIRKNAEVRIISWNERNLIDSNGKAMGSIVIGRDITEEKRLTNEIKRYSDHLEQLVKERTAELQAAKRRLEYVISSNPAEIYVAKPLPDLSGYYTTYLSKHVTSTVGFESDELIGEKGNELWASRVHPEDLVAIRAAMVEFWKEGHGVFAYRFRNKNGDYRWIREEANVILDADRRPLEVVGYSTDITELKEMEKRLTESERLAAVGQAAAMVGHDLRNPLQATAGTLYLARELLDSGQLEGAKKNVIELLDSLDSQVHYMDKIVSDLQDYARPVYTELIETNLPALVEEAISSTKTPSNVEVSTMIQEGLTKIMIDPVLLKRVLINLALNGVQAMPNGGKLTITAGKTQDSIVISVQDSGVGIPAENLNRIFNPFFTTKAQGQGLGLAVCKRLIEAQGGTITVQSEPSKGSTFTIKIPLPKTTGIN